jgi:hypothetical protein
MDLVQTLWTTVVDHPYTLLGPLVVAEGPAATVLAGSLVGAGIAARCIYSAVSATGRGSGGCCAGWG